MNVTQVDHTDDEALAGGKRNTAERTQTVYVDKLRTFIEKSLKITNIDPISIAQLCTQS